MPPPGRDFDREMQVLEAEVKRLEAEFNMFFAGRLPRPPWETRNRVAGLVKRYDRMYIQNTADRFRFNMLQARFAKFCELWERQMIAQEGGRLRARTAAGAVQPPATASETREAGEPAPTPASATPAPGHPDAAAPSGTSPAAASAAHASAPKRPAAGGHEGVIHVAAVRDPVRESARVKELYERLAEAKRAAGEAPPPYERVAELVRTQVDKFKAKGQSASFRVAVKEGKVSLTVKPVSSDDETP
jgi:hypothetical protein